MDSSRGTSIALAVSALLAASGCGDGGGAEPQAAASAASIKCEGGNACRGLSECATADGKSACTGENACQGTGYVYTETEEQCTALQIRNKP